MFQVEEMVKHTEYTLGPIDILVNNAGIMFYTMMKNLKVEEWEKQIDINCKVIKATKQKQNPPTNRLSRKNVKNFLRLQIALC